MKKRRGPAALLLLACLIFCLHTGSAFAADLSAGNCVREKLGHCNITALATNRYSEGRPLIIFFPGSQECNSYQSVIRFIRNYHLYDSLDIDLIAVTLRGSGFWYKNWEGASMDLYEYIREKYEASPFPVLIDAVSFGGYGGCFLADYLRENGIPVQELNLADACGSYCISPDWIRDIALSGTRVNVFGCTGTATVSKDTRAVIEQLDGTENFSGLVLECRHGQVLSLAIHDHGLHAEYQSEAEPSSD